MRINKLNLQNFEGFERCELSLDGKSTVIFGVNGTGKSSILAAINYLCWNWVNRLNPSQGTASKSLDASLVRSGSSKLEISAEFELGGETFSLQKDYVKARSGKGASVTPHKKLYDAFVDRFMDMYGADDVPMPIFVNYGTNRSVLDVPLRIRKKHQFSKWAAFERALENELDYRTFFEWFRNQEDYEAELVRERQDFSYADVSLQCVRRAVQAMIPDFSDLQVKRNPLRLVVKKDGAELNVDKLSDGEKCTLALMGDLARRLALANQGAEDPLHGEGLVLIDEIELHMHPSWQRKILPVLCQTFPNIQFIITTHSPQVLGEVNDHFNLFMLHSVAQQKAEVSRIDRMDGFDSNFILQEFMDTESINPAFGKLLERAYDAIDRCDFQCARKLIGDVRGIVGPNAASVIALEGSLKRGELLHEKNC